MNNSFPVFISFMLYYISTLSLYHSITLSLSLYQSHVLSLLYLILSMVHFFCVSKWLFLFLLFICFLSLHAYLLLCPSLSFILHFILFICSSILRSFHFILHSHWPICALRRSIETNTASLIDYGVCDVLYK